MTLSIDGKPFVFKVFTEDIAGCTPNSLGAARRHEDASLDFGSFCPSEFHAATTFHRDETTIKVLTIGGHFRYIHNMIILT